MIINANETGLIDFSGLKKWSKTTDEKIRSSFKEKKDSVSLELSPEGKTKSQYHQPVATKAVQEEIRTGCAPETARDFNRTGYAHIDNTIIDSLNGVSIETRQYVYDMINSDILINDASNISEDERQELISLGLSEAQFIADNYLSGDNAKDFMGAIKKMAGIAANGIREEDGTMDYGGIYNNNVTENGYTVQITNTAAMIKRFRPDMYEELRSIEKGEQGGDVWERLRASAKILNKFANEVIAKQPNMYRQFEKEGLERLEQASEKDVRDTFQHVETKGVQNFVDALTQLHGSGQFNAFSSLTNRLSTVISLLTPVIGRFGAQK